MISRKMVCRDSLAIGPGLRSATPRSTWASRSGRNTGALVSALTWPTSSATWARRFSRSRICASMASICSRRGFSLSVMLALCRLLSSAGSVRPALRRTAAVDSASREFVQIIDQGLHALDRHRVVDRCAHTADGLVALQLQQAALFSAGQECFVPAFVLQIKRDVHARA